jgi:hypothetical protein
VGLRDVHAGGHAPWKGGLVGKWLVVLLLRLHASDKLSQALVEVPECLGGVAEQGTTRDETIGNGLGLLDITSGGELDIKVLEHNARLTL